MLITQGKGVFLLGASAQLLDESSDRMQAWAEHHVRKDPDIKWILGNYVEATKANSNGHIFPLKDLPESQLTLPNKPLTMLHHDQYVVGNYAAGQLLDPGGHAMTTVADVEAFEAARTADDHPIMEALSAFWWRRFPDEYVAIKQAQREGTLFYSMEARPPTITCPTCSMTADFVGLTDESSPGTYCEHMNGVVLPKILNQPVFNGGAIIIPPVRPGWNRADVKAISKLMAEMADQAEGIYDAAKELAPHLGDREWEMVMAMVLEQATARKLTSEQRQELAKKGQALADGSYPIENISDLHNAMQAFGRSKPGDRSKVKKHLMKRARSLGAPKEVQQRIAQY